MGLLHQIMAAPARAYCVSDREQTTTDSRCDLKKSVPRRHWMPPLEAPQRAFATLPLCHSGLHLCINADWDVSASRDGVHENGHNEQLAEEAAQVFAALCRQFGLEMRAAFLGWQTLGLGSLPLRWTTWVIDLPCPATTLPKHQAP